MGNLGVASAVRPGEPRRWSRSLRSAMATDDDLFDARTEAELALLKRVTDLASNANGETVLRLAEALAWLERADQSH